MTYKKTIKLGTMPVEIEVEIRDREQGPELTISGAIWKPHRGDIVEGGQNTDSIAELFEDTPLAPKVQRIVEVWKRWHLNGMRAGCEHQRAEGWDKRPIDPSKPTDAYGRHFPGQGQPSWNMLAWVRPDEHPDGLLGKPCPVCGYKYGTAWLTEPLPEEIIAEVKSW